MRKNKILNLAVDNWSCAKKNKLLFFLNMFDFNQNYHCSC